MVEVRDVKSKAITARVGNRPIPAESPLYLKIQAELKARVISGRYAVGAALPTEADLCAEFAASRYTIREALRGLTASGLVSRRPRVGTIVLSPAPPSHYVQSIGAIEDLFQVAVETHYVLRSTKPVALDHDLAKQVGGSAGETWLRVSGVRWDRPGGSPICYIESYVPSRHAAIVADFKGLRGPFYALLEQRSGETIDEVRQEITAVPTPERAIAMLGLEPGALSLLLLRRYVAKRGTLITSFNWHRADQFSYRMRLRRRSGEDGA